MTEPNRNLKVQYFAGLCVSMGFVFTGAVLSWGSPAIPKFKSGDANLQITDHCQHYVLVGSGRGRLAATTFLPESGVKQLAVFSLCAGEPVASGQARFIIDLVSTFGPDWVQEVLQLGVVSGTGTAAAPPLQFSAHRLGRLCLAAALFVPLPQAQSSWVVSLVSLGSIPGCYLGHRLSERIGRRRTMLASAVPGLLGAVIILFTTLPALMIVARLMMGLTMGITAVVTMIYITEIADKDIRGALGMLVQVMNNIGSLIMYGIGPFVSYAMLNSIVLSIPIVYVLSCIWVPESPYYHLKDGRIAQAKKEFMIIKGTKDEKWIDEQLGDIRSHVRESMENKTTFKELITNKRYRKAIYIVTGLKILQYMTGNSAIQSYLEIIFRQSSSISGPHVSIVYGFVQLTAGIGATFLAGWFGRRVLMFLSSLGVAVSLTTVGIYFYLQDAIGLSKDVLASISFLPLVGILGFNILYAIGIGNLPYVMQAELFPINVKTVAGSAATMLACVLSFAVAKCYQGVKENFGHYTVFWSFAFVAYVGVFFIYCFVPETKGKTLEEVQDNMTARVVEMQALNEETNLES